MGMERDGGVPTVRSEHKSIVSTTYRHMLTRRGAGTLDLEAQYPNKVVRYTRYIPQEDEAALLRLLRIIQAIKPMVKGTIRETRW